MNFEEAFIPENSFTTHENVNEENFDLDLEFGQVLLQSIYCDEDFLVSNNNSSFNVAEKEQNSAVEFDLEAVLIGDQNDVCYFQDAQSSEESSEIVVVENEPCYLVGNPVIVSESNSSKSIIAEKSLGATFQSSADNFVESTFLVSSSIDSETIETQAQTENYAHLNKGCSSFFMGLSDQINSSNEAVPTSSNNEHTSQSASEYYLPVTNYQHEDNSNNNNSSTIFSDYEIVPTTVVVDQSGLKTTDKLKRKANEDKSEECYSSQGMQPPKKLKTKVVQVEIYHEEPQG